MQLLRLEKIILLGIIMAGIQTSPPPPPPKLVSKVPSEKVLHFLKFSHIYIYIYIEENTKKNHKRVVSVYVIQIHVDLHKLKL